MSLESSNCNISQVVKTLIPDNLTAESYLRELCYKGLKDRYETKISNVITDRLETELKVIKNKELIEHFLIIWEIVNWAKNNSIAVCPGSGSIASSVVAYTLQITDVDPIRFELFFEFFLNIETKVRPRFYFEVSNEDLDKIKNHILELYNFYYRLDSNELYIPELSLNISKLNSLSILKEAMILVEKNQNSSNLKEIRNNMILRNFLGLKEKSFENINCSIKNTEEINFVIRNMLNLDDISVYDIFQKGLTLGIYPGGTKMYNEFLKKLMPTKLDDIVALIALYNPSYLKNGLIDDFIKRKNGTQKFDYLHSSLESILEDTYGIYLYREQIIKTAVVLAGFTSNEANQFCKDLVKGNKIERLEARRKFIESSIKNGLNKKLSEKILASMIRFKIYRDIIPIKSHYVAQILMAYRSAFMKAYYPAEFLTAYLNLETKEIYKDSMYCSSDPNNKFTYNVTALLNYCFVDVKNECRVLGVEFNIPKKYDFESIFQTDGKKIWC